MSSMRFSDKRLTVLVGNYGSGKTELSIAIARHMKREERCETVLVDLDIVNPYFRSGEQKKLLTDEGIRVLMPTFAGTTVDIPALPAQIQSVFDSKNERAVFDVGGDDTGAAALGRYVEAFHAEINDLRCLFVINCMRPLTQTAEDILELMDRIAGRARMAFTGLVNNTNLAGDTTPEMLFDGQRIIETVSAKSDVPIVMIAGERHILSGMNPAHDARYFPIERVMKPEWMN